MSKPLTFFFMILFLLESLAAILENGFITMVLGREWIQFKTLPPCDMILASLGISRFFLQGLAVISNFYNYFFLASRNLYIDSFWCFINLITVWLATWLGVFYCVKISSFTHPLFLWLKWRISRLVPRLLLGSLLISTLIFMLCIIKLHLLFQQSIIGNYSEKSTLDDKIHRFQTQFFLPLQMFLFIPFCFLLVSSILLVSSLCQHLGKMQQHSTGHQDPSMQAHTVALKSLFFFFVIYAIYIISLIVSTILSVSVSSFWFWVWEAVTYAGLSIHSAFLILRSPKLRRTLKKMLQQPRGCIRGIQLWSPQYC